MSSSTLRAKNGNISERMRRKTVQRLGDTAKKQDARRASVLAADRAWKRLFQQLSNMYAALPSSSTAANGGGTGSGLRDAGVADNHAFEDLHSVSSVAAAAADHAAYNLYEDYDYDCNASLLSGNSGSGKNGGSLVDSERATLRGIKRGLRESNEARRHNRGAAGDDALSASEFDLATIAETNATDNNAFKLLKLQKRTKNFIRKRRGWKRVIKFARKTAARSVGGGSRHSKADDDGDGASAASCCDAWMCGVCGMAFSSVTTAEKHERQHIADVVAGMEWNNKTKTTTTSNNGDAGGLSRMRNTAGTAVPSPLPLTDAAANSILVRKSAYYENHHHSSNMNSSSLMVHFDKVPPVNSLPPRNDDDAVQYPDSTRAVGSASLNISDTVGFRMSRDDDDEVKLEDGEDANDDGYPGLEADLPSGALLPKPRSRTFSNQEVRFASDPLSGCDVAGGGGNGNYQYGEDALLLSNDMKDHVVLADEALFDVVSRAVPMILTRAEVRAERELALLARDKAYYDELSKRAAARRVNPSNRFRSDGENLLAKVQNKFLDAYQLMKESDGKKGISDQYNRKTKIGEEAVSSIFLTDNSTLYVNVMVKNSVQVVRHELERLAKQRWEVAATAADDEDLTRFERFRVYTQVNVVKLAGIALASDFTVRVLHT